LKGLERYLLEYVVAKAEPGNPESVLAAMDAFWNKTFQSQNSEQWNIRGQKIEEMVKDIVEKKTQANSKRPVRCLELGTYCGYSALRIAMSLPEGGFLLSVEKDELFAAIATKILEFAGLDHKVKIWMGTVHSELANITDRLQNEPADFILCDHSKERYVPDMKMMQDCGVVSETTAVIGGVEVYPGDEQLPTEVQKEIDQFFDNSSFNFVMV
jgi:catechol O-methyltransferase